MTQHTCSRRSSVPRRFAAAVLLLVGTGVGLSHAVASGGGRIKPLLSVAVGERYDGNVMLQNEGAEADRESWVTSVLPVVGVETRSATNSVHHAATLQYAPDFTFFHQLSRESYLRHVGLFDFDLAHKGFNADVAFKGQYTDGTTAPPVWGTTAAGDQAPAIGAPEVRNRRRGAQWSTTVSGRQQVSRWFVRGVFDARIWDFMTDDTFVAGQAIQNYYDRSDINGGFDLGFEVHPAVEPYLGYRLGHQDQEYREVPSYDPTAPSYSYANQYHRFFAGATVRPWRRVTLGGEIGPSLHFFDVSTIQSSDAGHSQRDYLYFKFNAGVSLSSNTTLKVAAGQHLLPSSAGNAVFQWITAAGTLTHRFDPKFTGSLRYSFTEYDFDGGINRRDDVQVCETALAYALNAHLTARVFYTYEWGANLLDIPNGSKRDYNRHVAGIQVNAQY